jgi:hypothetical protein
MKKLHSADIVKQLGQPVIWETATDACSELLEVNVIFTEPEATAAALKAAESLAQGLGAYIRLRSAIAVPLRLPLNQSPVSIRFMERLLSDLVGQAGLDQSQLTGHVYVCRDRIKAFLHVLKPNSLVVIGGRKHWWPTETSRLAEKFRAKGHRVVFVGVREQATGRRQ